MMPPQPDLFLIIERWVLTLLMVTVVRAVWRARGVNGPITTALSEMFFAWLFLLAWYDARDTTLYFGHWFPFLSRYAWTVWFPLYGAIMRFHMARRRNVVPVFRQGMLRRLWNHARAFPKVGP